MDHSVTEPDSSAHHINIARVEMRMIRSEYIKHAPRDLRVEVGQALSKARSIVGWTQDELAREVAKALGREKADQPRVSRWEKGTERYPLDVLLLIEPLAWPLIHQLAALDKRNEVTTLIQRRA